jgi:putative intracellular protease/amidase
MASNFLHATKSHRSLYAIAVGVFLLFQTVAADELEWKSLLPSIDPEQHSVVGQWRKSDHSLLVNAVEGARLSLAVEAREEYDLRVSFTRRTGQHSIGAIVVHGGRQVAFELDAWGMNLAGFQDIGGKTLRDNPTRRENVRLVNGRRYTMTVQVRKNLIRGVLDDQEIAQHLSDGNGLSLSNLWRMPNQHTLGLIAWDSETEFHSIEIRSANGEPSRIANSQPQNTNSQTNVATNPPMQTTSSGSSASGKHVLIVIANDDFFYREYAEPRAELENAGVRVTVAAGRKAPSRPHSNSGQGSDGGVVVPDLALSDVRVQDYDAILFSGGWGASMYQYAFPGRYRNASYNGDRATKMEVNRIINEFLQQDKYVCALCNAVSVLAWARVNGKSPLAGKRVCAPTRQAPAGIYHGQPAQPSCRWHPEQNGAIMSPAGSIGQPNSAHDDVLVDGKIITGEDDPSAREMGRRMVAVLR